MMTGKIHPSNFNMRSKDRALRRHVLCRTQALDSLDIIYLFVVVVYREILFMSKG
jgi:hypothetical protein